jgi:hypothetical protein
MKPSKKPAPKKNPKPTMGRTPKPGYKDGGMTKKGGKGC